MSKTDIFTQCILRQGNRYTYSWIPKPFAVVGKPLKLKRKGVWEDGWVVLETWADQAAEVCLAQEMDHKKHRKGTDAHRDKDGWVGPDR